MVRKATVSEKQPQASDDGLNNRDPCDPRRSGKLCGVRPMVTPRSVGVVLTVDTPLPGDWLDSEMVNWSMTEGIA